MDNDLKKLVHEEINEPLNKIVDIFTPKPKKKVHNLVVFWIIVGVLAVFLFYYAYKLLYTYF